MDKYKNFDDLKANEDVRNYRIEMTDRSTEQLIVAPHGGKIEPGTSEIARAVAGENFSLYMFEGHKPKANRDLHITSSNFDEPQALALAGKANTILGIHGCQNENDPATILVGGRDAALADAMVAALNAQGFAAKIDTTRFPARHPKNICNRGNSGMGAQLEIPADVRARVMGDINEFGRLVAAIRSALSA